MRYRREVYIIIYILLTMTISGCTVNIEDVNGIRLSKECQDNIYKMYQTGSSENITDCDIYFLKGGLNETEVIGTNISIGENKTVLPLEDTNISRENQGD